MIVKLLTEHHLEFLSLKGGGRGWSKSTLVKNQIVGNFMLRFKCQGKPSNFPCFIKKSWVSFSFLAKQLCNHIYKLYYNSDTSDQTVQIQIKPRLVEHFNTTRRPPNQLFIPMTI